MPKNVVLVTEAEFRRARSSFAAGGELECIPVAGAEEPLCDAIVHHGTRLIVVGSAPYRGRLYTTLPRGGVIARFGVGYDNVDTAQATRAGLLCTNTPDVLQQSVAELTMFLIGLAARHLVSAAAGVQAGRWEPREGIELEGKTLALIGCGAIARAVARIASAGFGMRVIAHARSPRDVPGPEFAAVTTDYEEAVRGADFVSLHIPGSPANARFMGGEAGG